jgi:CP family cyanate transporter-like MFS transporter
MLGLAWLIYFFFGMMTFSLAPILPTLESELHFSNAEAGLLLGAYPLAYVFTALIVGRLCDRFGVKRSVMGGVLLISLSALLRAPAQTYVQLLLATLLLGVGGPVVSTVLPKLVSEWFVGRNRMTAIGLYLTGPTLGGAFSLGLTGTLVSILGSWRTLYVVYSLWGLVLLAIWTVFAVDSPRPVAPRILESAPASPAVAVWRQPAVWMVVLAGIAGFVIGQGFISWIPTILRSQGLSQGAAALWSGSSRFCTLCGNVVLTYFIARMLRPRARRDAAVLIIMVSAFCVASAALGIPGLTITGLLLQSLLAGALMPLLVGFLLDLPTLASAQVSTAAGLYFTVGQISAAASPVLVGLLRDATGGFEVGIIAVASVAMAAAVPASRITVSRPVEVDLTPLPPGGVSVGEVTA